MTNAFYMLCIHSEVRLTLRRYILALTFTGGMIRPLTIKLSQIMKKFIFYSVVMLLITACDDDNSSAPPVAMNCIAQKFLPETNDPNQPVAYKERYEISNTAPITSDTYSEVPSNYCVLQSGYSNAESVLTVKNSGVLSLNYDSGNHTDGSFHKFTSSDPDFEDDTLVYDIRYDGSLTDAGVVYHLTTERSAGYFYSVYEIRDGVSTNVGTFDGLRELEASPFSFLISSPGILNSAELNQLYNDHLSF